jgi:nitrite reductase (cytochrome c-552)
LLSNVYERQDKNREIAAESEMLLVRAHLEAGKAWSLGATEEEMKPALKLIRHAQWRWDFAVASHGASFHAPLEVARILSSSVNKAQEARLLLSRILSRRGFNSEVPLPDISTKEKAQLYIGLDIEAEKQQKKRFIEEVVPKWDEAAKQRESAWGS